MEQRKYVLKYQPRYNFLFKKEKKYIKTPKK